MTTTPTLDDEPDELEVDCGPFIARIRMALAEGGYPDADVYFEATGVFVDGAPDDVVDRAVDLAQLADAAPSHLDASEGR